MKNRCLDPNHTSYSRYGGRGITIDERWYQFDNFYTDMADGYEKGLDLDRRDNDRGYSKENCRWIPHQKNIWNQAPKKGLSQFVGVSLDKRNGHWVSAIRDEGKVVKLGTFTDEKQAAVAYDTKCIELRGDFAVLNRYCYPDAFQEAA